MSELIKESVFSAYVKWQRLDRLGRPVHRSGFTQPDTLKINHTAGDGREHTAYIVPDQGMNGPEWALYYTIPQYKENLLERFNLTNHTIFFFFNLHFHLPHSPKVLPVIFTVINNVILHELLISNKMLCTVGA